MSSKYLEVSENVREDNLQEIQKIINQFLEFEVSKIYRNSLTNLNKIEQVQSKLNSNQTKKRAKKKSDTL